MIQKNKTIRVQIAYDISVMSIDGLSSDTNNKGVFLSWRRDGAREAEGREAALSRKASWMPMDNTPSLSVAERSQANKFKSGETERVVCADGCAGTHLRLFRFDRVRGR